MDFLKKYFAGQLTPQEEAQVQAWLVEHSEDPQVQDALLAIMSEMETEDMAVSVPAYVKVAGSLGLERKSRFEKSLKTIGRWAMGIAACVMLPLLGVFVYGMLSVPEQAEWLELRVPYGIPRQRTQDLRRRRGLRRGCQRPGTAFHHSVGRC